MRKDRFHPPEINLTPLIDVVFVILISFMVVAPLLDLENIQLAEAGPQITKSESDKNRLQVHVFPDNSIRLNDQKMQFAQFKVAVRKLHEKMPGLKPLLFHDKRAQFGTYQEVKNALEVAGYSELDLVVTPR